MKRKSILISDFCESNSPKKSISSNQANFKTQQNGHRQKFFEQPASSNQSPTGKSGTKPVSPDRSCLTGRSGAKLVSPEYSSRNGNVADARVRHIKPSQTGSKPVTDEPDFSRVRNNQLKPENEVSDFSRIRNNQLKPENEDSEFSRLMQLGSGKRVTPSPLKRLSGLVRNFI
jgi:hypothetical protein